MKKVLIIGGTGTISTPITNRLVKDKEVELYVLNRGTKNIQLANGVHYLKADIFQKKEIEELMKDISFDSIINFIVWNKENAKACIDLFKDKTKQFIYISTVCVLNHEITCNINEECIRGNMYSDYGREKAEAEETFLRAYQEFGFPITIVRPTQTYSNERIPLSVKGKGSYSVVSRMLQGKKVIIHGDGQSVWASTHAIDFAKGFCSLVGNNKSIGQIYQIMNNTPHTWDMLYRKLADLLNVEYKPVYISTELLQHSRQYQFSQSIKGDKHWSNIFDTSKIKRINPEFNCSIQIEDGLKMYLDYIEQHPQVKIEEPEFDLWCEETIALYEKTSKLFISQIK